MEDRALEEKLILSRQQHHFWLRRCYFQRWEQHYHQSVLAGARNRLAQAHWRPIILAKLFKEWVGWGL